MGLAQWVLVEARSRAGLGLRELARRAGTSHSTLRRYERGDTDPTVRTLERLVKACGFELRILVAEATSAEKDVEEAFARLTPAERLQTLANWSRLRGRASEDSQ